MKKRKPAGKRNPDVTEETRKKISTRLKEKWRDPAYRERRKSCMPNRRGIPHSDETKARISAAVKEKWNDPAYREKVCVRGGGGGARSGKGWGRRREAVGWWTGEIGASRSAAPTCLQVRFGSEAPLFALQEIYQSILVFASSSV